MDDHDESLSVVRGIATAVILGIGFYVGCWILGRCLGWW